MGKIMKNKKGLELVTSLIGLKNMFWIIHKWSPPKNLQILSLKATTTLFPPIDGISYYLKHSLHGNILSAIHMLYMYIQQIVLVTKSSLSKFLVKCILLTVSFLSSRNHSFLNIIVIIISFCKDGVLQIIIIISPFAHPETSRIYLTPFPSSQGCHWWMTPLQKFIFWSDLLNLETLKKREKPTKHWISQEQKVIFRGNKNHFS